MASVTVGGGYEVFGNMEALHRVQNWIMMDSKHPVEREDVRRSLARRLAQVEFFCAILLACSENRAKSLEIMEGFIADMKKTSANG